MLKYPEIMVKYPEIMVKYPEIMVKYPEIILKYPGPFTYLLWPVKEAIRQGLLYQLNFGRTWRGSAKFRVESLGPIL